MLSLSHAKYPAIHRRNFCTATPFNNGKPSPWRKLKKEPADMNHRTAEAFEQDTSPLKVNLGRGVYKDDLGKNFVLPCVREAEKIIQDSKPDHDYLPFKGLASFVKHTQEFMFGANSKLLQEGRVASIQTVSGTGALRVGGEFLQRLVPNSGHVYLPTPTYVNHTTIFGDTLPVERKSYTYYNPNTHQIDVNKMAADLERAPNGSIILFHACGHNPTGLDPTTAQWQQILDYIQQKELIVFFDSAYQGFASGDPERDAAAVRLFADAGVPILVAQSFSKNFGLYGNRVGALHLVTSSANETNIVLSNLNKIVRPLYSNPPVHGARIVSTIFGDPKLRAQWQQDVKTMADRLNGVRKSLVENLQELGSKRPWDHIQRQIGMFSYTGLSTAEVMALRDRHIYMNEDSRASVTGINTKNVAYLAKALHEVTKDSPYPHKPQPNSTRWDGL